MANRLGSATSPYLLQHKDNPVDWWEWGEEAFASARDRDVPVLVSVGYAACHWCHVMAHESFENEQIAALMNELFVNVKVDREERPDVDSIYMEAVQAMTGHGGWPMTVWIDHDGRPFYAGTYFPKLAHHGMPSFQQVIEAVSSAWRARRNEVLDQADRLTQAINREIPHGDVPEEDGLASAYRAIEAAFDHRHGGFGSAPKFPQQPVLEFLLRARGKTWAPLAEGMLAKTLEAMAAGGIHDHLGGGFARYSVDDRWLVPHFEKMLYDNAQLSRLYLWAGVELDRPDFLDVARSTLHYVLRDLGHPGGGFYSSEDADSEGVEGKFYVWTPRQVRAVLGERADEIIDYFGITPEGNFEGANILNVVGTETPADLGRSKRDLFEARAKRVRPGLDDKIVTSWNGLAIRALSEAGAVLAEPELVGAAEESASFILDHLMVEGTLMRSWRDDEVSVAGFLDDHASLAVALFVLYSATGNTRWHRAATDLAGRLELFERPDGGFFQTRSDTPALVKRPIDITDNPLPSGNALAAEALLMASLFNGDPALASASERTLEAAGALMARFPTMVGHHLAVALSSRHTAEVAIVGETWRELATVYWSRYRPGSVLAGAPNGSDAVPLLAGRGAEVTSAYVCHGFVCDLPTSDPQELEVQLADSAR